MSLFGFGLRDVMLVLVAFAAVYIVFLLLKLVQIGKRRSHESADTERMESVSLESPARQRKEPDWVPPSAAPVQGVVADPLASQWQDGAVGAAESEGFAVPPAPTFEWEEVKELFGEEERPPATQQRDGGQRGGGFGEPLANHLARSEMDMELQRMRDEMARMRAEVEALRNARHVSPQYAEAMELAQRGATAQHIADQLGISQAEAELVQALSRGRNDFAEGDEDGAEPYANGIRGFDELARRRAG